MPLFHIQDDTRPAWVMAKNYEDALRKWRRAVTHEHGGKEGLPRGVAHVARDCEIIIGDGWVKALD